MRLLEVWMDGQTRRADIKTMSPLWRESRKNNLMSYYELNKVDLDRWLTTPPDEYGFEADYISACAGFGCVDGCGDCVPPAYALVTIPGVELPAVPFGCEWCFILHDAQHCPAIRAVLFADEPPVDIPDEPYPPTPGGPEPPEWRTR